jgi:hypothetical protein
LQQIEKLIAVSTADFVTKEDLTTLQRLISEFGTELATLRTRVDNLEGRTKFLEENQFSTTTKLSGLAWFNVTGASASDDITVEAAGSAYTFGTQKSRTRCEFQTNSAKNKRRS